MNDQTSINTPRRAARLGALAALAALAGTLGACADLEHSRDLADARVAPAVTAQQVCSLCHGIDGIGTAAPHVPRLAGQPRDYVVAQLTGFRSRQRADPEGYEYMWGIARRLTDAQIEGLADYYAALPPPPASGTGTDAALGRKIFEEGLPDRGTPACATCHGPDGAGMATFPRLAGQHRAYLVRQLEVFQRRAGRPNTPMDAVTHEMTAREMRAVADFLQGDGRG
jgi:cytochrome c553